MVGSQRASGPLPLRWSACTTFGPRPFLSIMCGALEQMVPQAPIRSIRAPLTRHMVSGMGVVRSDTRFASSNILLMTSARDWERPMRHERWRDSPAVLRGEVGHGERLVIGEPAEVSHLPVARPLLLALGRFRPMPLGSHRVRSWTLPRLMPRLLLELAPGDDQQVLACVHLALEHGPAICVLPGEVRTPG